MSRRYETCPVPGTTKCREDASTTDESESRLSGGRGALDALYRSQAGRLLRIFNRRIGPQDAPDLVQETFARFAQATLEREATLVCPESYLTQVAINVMRDRGRSASYRAALRAVPVEEVDVEARDEQSALEARDMLNRVETVMLQLKPMTRDIFIARRFHGFSRAEIAAQTGLSVKAIDKHLAKAVEHLHRHLGDHDAP